MSVSAASLRDEALALERTYLAGLEGSVVSDLEGRCRAFFHHTSAALNGGALSPSTLATLRRVVSRIAIISAGLVELEKDHRRIKENAIGSLRESLAEQQPFNPPSISSGTTSSSSPDPSNPDDPAHYLPYRLWFLSNFSSPYPSPAQKDSLLTLVPIHNKQQLDTWFTNNRRRSGWQALKREETDGTAEGMERLLRRVDRDEENVEERVRERVRKVRAFFEDGGAKDRVSEGIAAIVGGVAGPAPVPPTKTAMPRRVEKRATRGVSSSSLSSPPAAFPSPAVETRPSPYSRQSTPPRQPRQHQPQPTFSYGDVVLSPSTTTTSSSSFGDAFSAPRYPSTFSSPASSTRTVSSSSSSSLDSLISYASAQSTLPPFSSYPIETPSSPPASSSLLSFAGPTSSCRSASSSSYAPYPPPSTRRTSRPPQQPQQLAPNPYFCTLADLPSSSSLLFGAGSSMSAMRR